MANPLSNKLERKCIIAKKRGNATAIKAALGHLLPKIALEAITGEAGMAVDKSLPLRH